MTCETDACYNPLPDEQRLTRYGKFLRASSLDELSEHFSILKGDMSNEGNRDVIEITKRNYDFPRVVMV